MRTRPTRSWTLLPRIDWDLLYNVLRAFGKTNIQIALSRITTEKGAAIDSFYVTDAEGKKVNGADQLASLQQPLWHASQIHAPVF